MNHDLPDSFLLGEWRVAPLRGALLSRDGETRHIKPKAMDVLLCLADRAGQPVTRDELIHCVWGERGASDEVLTRTISDLRHALEDAAEQPRFIETIPKRGYRLIAAVQPAPEDCANRPDRAGRSYLLPGALALAAAVVSALFFVSNEDTSTATVTGEPVPANSVAVLPFDTYSSLADDTHFADGLHDDLLTLLTRLESLDRVISCRSTLRYRNTTKSIPEIGHELGVASVVTGSLQRAGNSVRINIQLVDVSSDSQIWAQTYDRELDVEQLFAMQTDIAREVVAALHGSLAESDERLLATLPTVSIDAYEQYILGRAALARRTGASLLKAREHFENALTHDPDYALAWTSLADVYTAMPEYLGTPEESLFDEREAAINRALAIDPASGEAYTNLADLYADRDQHETAEELFLRALDLAPNYATAHHWYGLFLRDTGRVELALVQLSKALELDPFAPVLSTVSADLHMALGMYDEAASILSSAIERNSEFPGFFSSLANLRIRQGHFDIGLLLIDHAIELNPTNVFYNRNRCYLLRNLGDGPAATECTNHIAREFPALENSSFIDLRLFEGDLPAALELMAVGPAHWERVRYAVTLTLAGRADEANSALRRLHPELYSSSPIELPDFWTAAAAMAVGRLLYLEGRHGRANELFDAVLEWPEPLPIHMPQYIYLTRGEKDLATGALRAALGDGQIGGWWALRQPIFLPLLHDAEWITVLESIEDEIALQRARYAKWRDDPEFCITCTEQQSLLAGP